MAEDDDDGGAPLLAVLLVPAPAPAVAAKAPKFKEAAAVVHASASSIRSTLLPDVVPGGTNPPPVPVPPGVVG